MEYEVIKKSGFPSWVAVDDFPASVFNQIADGRIHSKFGVLSHCDKDAASKGGHRRWVDGVIPDSVEKTAVTPDQPCIWDIAPAPEQHQIWNKAERSGAGSGWGEQQRQGSESGGGPRAYGGPTRSTHPEQVA